ncbi:hypothetical protein HMPREF1254_0143 [Prevotella sp. BV3P1]|nr:hypothetical protein HMPREF1254_0143 [Prevotella sp. BV3P1]
MTFAVIWAKRLCRCLAPFRIITLLFDRVKPVRILFLHLERFYKLALTGCETIFEVILFVSEEVWRPMRLNEQAN